MKKKQQRRVFLYRVEVTDNKGIKKRHVAESKGDCDENARRRIIHNTMEEGGSVQTITATDTKKKQPGDTGAAKRYFDE